MRRMNRNSKKRSDTRGRGGAKSLPHTVPALAHLLQPAVPRPNRPRPACPSAPEPSPGLLREAGTAFSRQPEPTAAVTSRRRRRLPLTGSPLWPRSPPAFSRTPTSFSEGGTSGHAGGGLKSSIFRQSRRAASLHASDILKVGMLKCLRPELQQQEQMKTNPWLETVLTPNNFKFPPAKTDRLMSLDSSNLVNSCSSSLSSHGHLPGRVLTSRDSFNISPP